MQWHNRLVPIGVFAAAAFLAASPAFADITISAQPTANMSCSGGVCVPTAAKAVLNASDLETLLASGNVTVTTTGSGVQARNIKVSAPLSWSTASSLSLDAYQSITADKPVSVQGTGGLSVVTNDGGKNGFFAFYDKGHVMFENLTSSLTINGAAYTLVNNIASLASTIAANPTGDYALANAYNAKVDGTYSSSPIGTTFTGNFEGLGNTVSHLAIHDKNPNDNVGFFAEIGQGGNVANLKLAKVAINVTGIGNPTGGLAGWNYGVIQGAMVTGVIDLKDTEGAGLVGNNEGTISRSSVSISIDANDATAGALVGSNGGAITLSNAAGSIYGIISKNRPCCGTLGGLVASSGSGSIDQCFSSVSVVGQGKWAAAGLAGGSFGSITRSYATGSISVDAGSIIGTFVSAEDSGSTASQTYGTGLLKVGKEGTKGGFVGIDNSQPGSIASSYWDTTTSGFGNLKHGAGNLKNDPGITGLTSTQLESGLPAGFDPAIWAEDSNINNGFPYLIANPPLK